MLFEVLRRAYRKALPWNIRRQVRKIYGADRGELFSVVSKRPKFSFVLVTENVATCVEDFIGSILSQEGGWADLEVICIDNGSKDTTAQILDSLSSQYPDLIKVIVHQKRNSTGAYEIGLSAASGRWVSFPQAHDLLHKEYLLRSRGAVSIDHPHPLLAVYTKPAVYHHETGELRDKHPLGKFFRKDISHEHTDRLKRFIFPFAAGIWLERDAARRCVALFEGNDLSAGRDACFVNAILMSEKNSVVTFAKQAIYGHCRHSGSTLSGRQTKGEQIHSLSEGVLDLARLSRQMLGHVPVFVQRVILYRLFIMLRNMEESCDLSHAQGVDLEHAKAFQSLREVFKYVDAKTIEHFNLAGCIDKHKVAFFALFKDARRSVPVIHFNPQLSVGSQFSFSWYSGAKNECVPQVAVNGNVVDYTASWNHTKCIMGQRYYTRGMLMVDLQYGDSVSFIFDETSAVIKLQGKELGTTASVKVLLNAAIIPPPRSHDLATNPEARRLRALATQAETLKLYHGCWVFMDSHHRADDNAEHLYRHFMKQPEFAGKIWFVLDPGSVDWPRLEADGFRLLKYLSDDHIVAQLHAEFLISSHIDEYVLWPVPKHLFGDLVSYKFVFLQHGVISNDLSSWLNSKPISMFVTAAVSEYNSISGQNSPYVFIEKEVALTGLPRHDQLLQKAALIQPDSLLIAPTWRRYLLSKTHDGQLKDNHNWAKSDQFFQSEFYRNWRTILLNPRLIEIAKAHNLNIIFAPHQTMSRYVEDFALPSEITIFDATQGASYQDLLAHGRMLVTDFSSMAFEMAYLDRPVAYFEFEDERLFEGSHVYQRGYFNSAQDGFGPVSRSADDLFTAIEEALNQKEDTVYGDRRRQFFAYHDGQCCARVQDEMSKIAKGKPLRAW